jgi:acetyl esterase/lipase
MSTRAFETIPYGALPDQFGELWLPDGASRRTVVLIHGGFWREPYLIDRQRLSAEALAEAGFTVWNIEYRRVGGAGGYPETLLDVASAVDKLAELGVDVGDVASVGHSAGGHLAVWAASRSVLPDGAPGSSPRVAITTAVSQGGAVDLVTAAGERTGDSAAVEFLGGTPEAVPERYAVADPTLLVPVAARVVCVHGEDAVVPFSHAERYVAAAQAAGMDATLVAVAGDHEAHRIPHTEAWEAMATAIGG